MKLMLTGLGRVEIKTADRPDPADGMKVLKVNYCGVCRTDAKMWKEGQRDLVFPRVPGHEILAEDETGNACTVWPGNACGRCRFCLSGRENLCETMKIMGFHFDGGYSNYFLVPEKSVIPVPIEIASHLACFAEPVGCVINALEKINLQPDERIIIFGGGTLGLITALVAKTMGAAPLVIEKSAEKIARGSNFMAAEQVDCRRETTRSNFDCAVNACPDPAAFNLGITKLIKGGRMVFFSGISKNRKVETNLLNLIHYREIALTGAYGLTRRHMASALNIIQKFPSRFEMLVEAIVSPNQIENVFSQVVEAGAFKFILDFTKNKKNTSDFNSLEVKPTSFSTTISTGGPMKNRLFERTCEAVQAVSEDLLPEAQHKMDNKTKPLGALGQLESLAIQMCLVQKSLSPRIENKALLVFAADHGIAEEGVSAYPAEVTGQMVLNFLGGGAAINVLCRHHDIEMRIVDMGVNGDLEPHPELIDKKVRRGTRNFALEPAMTREEAIQALEAGMSCLLDVHSRRPLQILGLGEMGIGNTTSASAIISAATGISPEEATGRGTGIDDAGFRHKIGIIEKALSFHQPDAKNGLDILCKVGGLEVAGIAGAALAAASKGVAVVLDGIISTAAGLIAYLICPKIGGYLISGHRSVEIGQAVALETLGLKPVIDLEMRLGEGTGAALTIDVVAAACRIMNEMASFEEAGVSEQS